MSAREPREANTLERLWELARSCQLHGAPQKPRGDTSVRSPPGSEKGECLRRGHLLQPIGEAKTVADAEVIDRQDVGPAQPEHEHHFDCPPADAANLREACDDLFVAERAQRLVIGYHEGECLLREVAQRGYLCIGESGRAQRCFGSGEHGLGSWKQPVSAATADKAAENRVGGGSVELLVSNRLSEGLEGRAIRLNDHCRGAHRANDAAQDGVDGRQVCDRELAHDGGHSRKYPVGYFWQVAQ